MAPEVLRRRQIATGWTMEDLELVLQPMAETGREPIGSMGDDTPLAVLSEGYRGLHHFFRQNFSQVTNPPIDPVRESRVMSLKTRLGNLGNVLDEDESQLRLMELESPVLTNAQTCFPSVEGEGEAEFPSSPRTTRLPLPRVRFQRTLPSVLMHRSTRFFPSAEVRNIRSSHTTGVAPAGPGSSSRQRMFSVLLHCTGSPSSRLVPSYRSPRQCGQFSAGTDPTTANRIMLNITIDQYFIEIKFRGMEYKVCI